VARNDIGFMIETRKFHDRQAACKTMVLNLGGMQPLAVSSYLTVCIKLDGLKIHGRQDSRADWEGASRMWSLSRSRSRRLLVFPSTCLIKGSIDRENTTISPRGFYPNAVVSH
jgi:hypothetical protein